MTDQLSRAAGGTVAPHAEGLYEVGYFPIFPTEEGRALLDYARRLLRLHDEACSLFTAPGVSGQLRVGLPEELMEDAFPAVLQAFAQA